MTSKLASVHAGLVARKGEAMPALSNPGFSFVDTPRPARENAVHIQPSTLASQTSEPGTTIDQPTGHRPPAQDIITSARPPSETVRAASPQKPVRQTLENSHSGPYKLTFRMTKDQRRRLRIAAAQRDMSLQQVLSEALDNHLDGLCACSLEACNCLARKQDQQN